VDELECTLVRSPGFVDPIEAAKELRPRGVEVVVAVELEPPGEGECRFRLTRLREGGGSVELRDRRPRRAGQLADGVSP
jgi:hypothetical protein